MPLHSFKPDFFLSKNKIAKIQNKNTGGAYEMPLILIFKKTFLFFPQSGYYYYFLVLNYVFSKCLTKNSQINKKSLR
jgi:hypothetical protein